MINKIKLLSEEELIKTGPVDHADWNYKSVIKYIQQKRFKLCMKLIKNSRSERLLEIGKILLDYTGLFDIAEYANCLTRNLSERGSLPQIRIYLK